MVQTSQQPPKSTTSPPLTPLPSVLQSHEERILKIEAREELTAQQLLLKIEQGLKALDEQRKKYHEQFLQKVKEFITEVRALKEKLQKVIEEQQHKTSHATLDALLFY